MHEDLEPIANLKFGLENEEIIRETQNTLREEVSRQAARGSVGLWLNVNRRRVQLRAALSHIEAAENSLCYKVTVVRPPVVSHCEETRGLVVALGPIQVPSGPTMQVNLISR